MRTAATTASRIARRGYLPQRNERLNCQQAVAMYSTISKTMCITASYFLRNRSITHQAVGKKELAAEKSITQPLCKSLYSLDRQTCLLSLIEASDHGATEVGFSTLVVGATELAPQQRQRKTATCETSRRRYV